MGKIVWASEKRKISDLKPAAYNPRRMTKEQAEDLDRSLAKFSLADPIVINKNNTIIGGHQRINILKSKNIEEVDVRIPDRLLNEKEEKELNLRLNKNLGEWDIELLGKIDEETLKIVGFSNDELDDIFNIDLKTDEKEDDVPDKRKTDIKLGDVFQLGDHRLMCGDAKKRDDVAHLMGDEKADMIHTDPPYNCDYGASKKEGSKNIENDKQSADEWAQFCQDCFKNMKEFNNGDIYMWGAPGPDGMRMRLWLIDMGCHWSATIVWKKQQLVLSPAKYQRMYEPCFYGWFGKSTYGADRKQTEVWEVDRPHKSDLHPTMKPVELCERPLLNSSKWNDIVLDLFGGSGSTLIACAKVNRRCRMMELDPGYCQVIIDRWEAYVGQTAKRI